MKIIAFTRSARRDLRVLDTAVRDDVLADLAAYAEASEGFEAARLEGVDALRMRVGAYRVIFRETRTTITVLAVRHRAVVYQRIRRKK